MTVASEKSYTIKDGSNYQTKFTAAKDKEIKMEFTLANDLKDKDDKTVFGIIESKILTAGTEKLLSGATFDGTVLV